MAERYQQILQELYHTQEWCTGNYLAEKLGVSTRTIRSDIDKINQRWPKSILSHTRQGYRLANAGVLQNILSHSKEMLTPEKRMVYIFRQLFETGTSLEKLEDSLFVSRSTLNTDFAKIRNLLSVYPDLTLEKKKGEISLSGSEHSKRKLYKNLLSSEFNEQFIRSEQIFSLYPTIDLERAVAVFEKCIDKHSYDLRPMALSMLYIHMGTMLERMIQTRFLPHNWIEETAGPKEMAISEDFFQSIQSFYPLEVPENEKNAFANLLTGYKTEISLAEEINFKGKNLNWSEMIESFLFQCKEYSGIDFSKDQELIHGLQLHFQGLVNRLIHGNRIYNPLLDEIKNQHPLLFDVAVCGSAHLKKILDEEINQEEIGFIALHLGAAYARLTENQLRQALLITSVNQNLTNMVRQKIEKLFAGRMTLVDTLTYWREDLLETYALDLVISIGPMIKSTSVQTVFISGLLTEADEQKIFSALQQMDRQHLLTTFSIQLDQLIQEDYFYTKLKKQTPTEVIEHMAGRLEEAGVVGPRFIQSVLERESLAATSFQYGLAIPHALEEDCKQSLISIAILDKPIKWGAYWVELIILLALSDKDKAILPLFFDWVGKVIEDKSFLEKLLSAQNKQQFIKNIIS